MSKPLDIHPAGCGEWAGWRRTGQPNPLSRGQVRIIAANGHKNRKNSLFLLTEAIIPIEELTDRSVYTDDKLQARRQFSCYTAAAPWAAFSAAWSLQSAAMRYHSFLGPPVVFTSSLNSGVSAIKYKNVVYVYNGINIHCV